jgi:hypothetical protein
MKNTVRDVKLDLMCPVEIVLRVLGRRKIWGYKIHLFYFSFHI